MYTAKARELRRCQATRKDGTRCRGWAVWGDELGRCTRHGGYIADRHIVGKTHATVCRCEAWNFPHRPGSGPCRWPDPPLQYMLVRKARDREARKEKRLTRSLTREPLTLFLYRLHRHNKTWIAKWRAASPWQHAE